MHGMWVHGNTAVAEFVGGISITSPGTQGHQTAQITNDERIMQPWTDIVGLPRGPGKTFRGQAGTSNNFHFCIPTPVILNDQRLRLDRVFALFSFDSGVLVTRFRVFDGPNLIDNSGRLRTPTTRRQFDGTRGLADLVEGTTLHTVEGSPEIFWGVGISVEVIFSFEADITFTSAGADFS